MIPSTIAIQNRELPDEPGVYLYYDADGKLLYVGKATSLVRRVSSYFTKAHDGRIAQMVSRIARIEYRPTPTVIEALVLEANLIKSLRPHYNILERDDKSFLYLVITNTPFPRPELIRGRELERLGINPFSKTLSEKARRRYFAVFGPYTSGPALRKALELIRRSIPWSTCRPPEETGKTKACFDAQIRRCPGVCRGAIDTKTYRRSIRQLMLFFDGKKGRVVSQLRREMETAARAQDFERAVRLRNQLFALEHIQDVALIMREEPSYAARDAGALDLNGRIEAYDISNISGTSAVGSMVVFEEGKPAKNEYRKFRIKTVRGANDVAMLEEVLRRRFRRSLATPRSWPLPEVLVIDGGEPQVNRAAAVMSSLGLRIPMLGLAKGFDRKQDRVVLPKFVEQDALMRAAVGRGKELFQRARDEAHRFAITYHRKLRSRIV